MPVEFNPDTGHVRLDRSTFERLRTWFAGPAAPPDGDELPAELAAAGALDDDQQLHPVLQLALTAVAAPMCRLTIRLVDGQGRAERGDVWLNAEVAALLLDLPGGRCELGILRPIFLPVMLLRIVALGPRPRLPQPPVPISPELLDQLTGPDPAGRASAEQQLADAGVSGVQRDWRIQASWQSADGSVGVRAIRVLDTRAGLWLVEAHADRAMLFATTPTAVWLALVGLLPTDQELPDLPSAPEGPARR